MKQKISMERLRRHVMNELVFEIDGDQFVIEPKVEDKIRLLEKVSSQKDKGQNITIFAEYLIEKFTEAGEDSDVELVKSFVYSNIETLIKQLSIGFKLAKPEDFEQKEVPNLI